MEERHSLLDLEVDQESGTQLLEASRWARFFGILVSTVTIFLFLLVLLGWSRWAKMATDYPGNNEELTQEVSKMAMIMFIAAFLFIAAIIAVVMVFLIKGANGIRNGIRNKDQVTFNSGLANMRNAFGMYAVIAIVLLLLSLIGFITN